MSLVDVTGISAAVMKTSTHAASLLQRAEVLLKKATPVLTKRRELLEQTAQERQASLRAMLPFVVPGDLSDSDRTSEAKVTEDGLIHYHPPPSQEALVSEKAELVGLHEQIIEVKKLKVDDKELEEALALAEARVSDLLSSLDGVTERLDEVRDLSDDMRLRLAAAMREIETSAQNLPSLESEEEELARNETRLRGLLDAAQLDVDRKREMIKALKSNKEKAQNKPNQRSDQKPSKSQSLQKKRESSSRASGLSQSDLEKLPQPVPPSERWITVGGFADTKEDMQRLKEGTTINEKHDILDMDDDDSPEGVWVKATKQPPPPSCSSDEPESQEPLYEEYNRARQLWKLAFHSLALKHFKETVTDGTGHSVQETDKDGSKADPKSGTSKSAVARALLSAAPFLSGKAPAEEILRDIASNVSPQFLKNNGDPIVNRKGCITMDNYESTTGRPYSLPFRRSNSSKRLLSEGKTRGQEECTHTDNRELDSPISSSATGGAVSTSMIMSSGLAQHTIKTQREEIASLKGEISRRRRRYKEGQIALLAMHDRYMYLRVELVALRHAMASIDYKLLKDLRAEIKFYEKERRSLYRQLFSLRTIARIDAPSEFALPPVVPIYDEDDEPFKSAFEGIKAAVEQQMNESKQPGGALYQQKIIDQQRFELASLKAQLEDMKRSNATLLKRLEIAERGALSAHDPLFLGTNDLHAALESSIENAIKQANKLQATIETSKRIHKEEMEKLKQQIESLNGQLAKRDKKISDQAGDIDRLLEAARYNNALRDEEGTRAEHNKAVSEELLLELESRITAIKRFGPAKTAMDLSTHLTTITNDAGCQLWPAFSDAGLGNDSGRMALLMPLRELSNQLYQPEAVEALLALANAAYTTFHGYVRDHATTRGALFTITNQLGLLADWWFGLSALVEKCFNNYFASLVDMFRRPSMCDKQLQIDYCSSPQDTPSVSSAPFKPSTKDLPTEPLAKGSLDLRIKQETPKRGVDISTQVDMERLAIASSPINAPSTPEAATTISGRIITSADSFIADQHVETRRVAGQKPHQESQAFATSGTLEVLPSRQILLPRDLTDAATRITHDFFPRVHASVQCDEIRRDYEPPIAISADEPELHSELALLRRQLDEARALASSTAITLETVTLERDDLLARVASLSAQRRDSESPKYGRIASVSQIHKRGNLTTSKVKNKIDTTTTKKDEVLPMESTMSAGTIEEATRGSSARKPLDTVLSVSIMRSVQTQTVNDYTWMTPADATVAGDSFIMQPRSLRPGCFKHLTNESKHPIADLSQPNTNAKETNNKQCDIIPPCAASQLTNPDSVYLSVELTQPSADKKQSANDTKHPTATLKQPLSNVKKPIDEVKRTAGTEQPNGVVMQPSPDAMTIATTQFGGHRGIIVVETVNAGVQAVVASCPRSTLTDPLQNSSYLSVKTNERERALLADLEGKSHIVAMLQNEVSELTKTLSALREEHLRSLERIRSLEMGTTTSTVDDASASGIITSAIDQLHSGSLDENNGRLVEKGHARSSGADPHHSTMPLKSKKPALTSNINPRSNISATNDRKLPISDHGSAGGAASHRSKELRRSAAALVMPEDIDTSNIDRSIHEGRDNDAPGGSSCPTKDDAAPFATGKHPAEPSDNSSEDISARTRPNSKAVATSSHPSSNAMAPELTEMLLDEAVSRMKLLSEDYCYLRQNLLEEWHDLFLFVVAHRDSEFERYSSALALLQERFLKEQDLQHEAMLSVFEDKMHLLSAKNEHDRESAINETRIRLGEELQKARWAANAAHAKQEKYLDLLKEQRDEAFRACDELRAFYSGINSAAPHESLYFVDCHPQLAIKDAIRAGEASSSAEVTSAVKELHASPKRAVHPSGQSQYNQQRRELTQKLIADNSARYAPHFALVELHHAISKLLSLLLNHSNSNLVESPIYGEVCRFFNHSNISSLSSALRDPSAIHSINMGSLVASSSPHVYPVTLERYRQLQEHLVETAHSDLAAVRWVTGALERRGNSHPLGLTEMMSMAGLSGARGRSLPSDLPVMHYDEHDGSNPCHRLGSAPRRPVSAKEEDKRDFLGADGGEGAWGADRPPSASSDALYRRVPLDAEDELQQAQPPRPPPTLEGRIRSAQPAATGASRSIQLAELPPISDSKQPKPLPANSKRVLLEPIYSSTPAASLIYPSPYTEKSEFIASTYISPSDATKAAADNKKVSWPVRGGTSLVINFRATSASGAAALIPRSADFTLIHDTNISRGKEAMLNGVHPQGLPARVGSAQPALCGRARTFLQAKHSLSPARIVPLHRLKKDSPK